MSLFYSGDFNVNLHNVSWNLTDMSAIDQFARNTSKIKGGDFAFDFRINRREDLKKDKE